MTSSTLLRCGALCCFCWAAAIAQTTSASAVPHLEKRGASTQLVVDGKPFLVLSGEWGNPTATTLENLKPLWEEAQQLHLNTITPALYWSQMEPVEGQFDFSLVDGMIQEAWRHNLRIAFVWFGSWKNSTSSYAPGWVKTDTKRFPRAMVRGGRPHETFSIFGEATREADAKAFRALMGHIKEVEGGQHTVIMMQVNNEVGFRGDSRDRSPLADEAFAKPVPKELMDYLQKNKEVLMPELRSAWSAAGYKMTGTWEEVFGKGEYTDEIFMAWYYARYNDQVAAAGKAEIPLPMWVNVWLIRPDYRPGQFPSGGAVPDVHDIWKAGAPHIEMLSPDNGGTGQHKYWWNRFAYPRNPFFVPETSGGVVGAASVYYAVGHLNAIGYEPFGIERDKPGSPLGRSYDVISQLAPVMLEARTKGKGWVDGVWFDALTRELEVDLGDYRLEVTPGGGRMPEPAAAAQEVAPDPSGIFVAVAPDEFYLAGTGISGNFVPLTPGPPNTAFTVYEDGKFVDGRWVRGLQEAAGDDIFRKALAVLAGRPTPRILHVKVYRF